MIIWISVGMVFCFLAGYGLATLLIARDPDLVRLKEDEAVIKKPQEGLVLVAVPPGVMRKLVVNPEGYDSSEARGMYARGVKGK